MVKDPVCGMEIDPNSAAAKLDHERKTYHFCSMGCKRTFEKEPQKYVGPHHEPADQEALKPSRLALATPSDGVRHALRKAPLTPFERHQQTCLRTPEEKRTE